MRSTVADASPVDNFYEEDRDRRTALCDRPCGSRFEALAGLSENSRSPAGEWMRSFAIITRSPNELCAELHNRLAVALLPEAWPVWLAEEAADQSQLKALLAPYPSDRMTCWSVSARVGNVKNNDPTLVEPVALSA